MIILVGGEKGGTGKSTLATNLAAYHAGQQENTSLLLFDADQQGTAATWTYYRRNNKDLTRIDYINVYDDVGSQLQEEQQNYKTIIVDCGGQDSGQLREAMLQADVMIAPFSASQNDLNTAPKLEDLLGKVESLNAALACFAVVNRFRNHPGLTEGEEAIQFLKQFRNFKTLDFIIHDRIAFVRSATQGQGVHEMSYFDRKAIKEIENLYEAIYAL
jgi:chromosome partitioning protein